MTVSSLEDQLIAACDGLWWSSESDYPVEVVWQIASDVDEGEQPSTLLHQIIDVKADKRLEIVEVEDFFEQALTAQPWHTAEDSAQLRQLRQLKDLLTESLQQLKVYRYDQIEVLIYILGYTPEGDIAGVKTCSVET